jgi:hypothetical protein
VGRLTMATALLSVALGSAFVIPAAAQAAPSAPAAPIIRTVAPNIPPNAQWEFEGATYPNTSAGLLACNSEGKLLFETYPKTDISWNCRLGSPDSGVYNLWILFEI